MLNDKEKDEILDRLLNKVKADSPTSEFVDLVMEELAFETQREKVSEAKLVSLFKHHALEQPSIDFTDDLMNQIKSEANPVDDPVISRIGWYAIFTTLGITLITIGFSGSNNSTSNASNVASKHFVDVGESLNSIIAQIHSFPSAFYLILIPICVLLLIDHVFLIKKTDSHHSYS